MLLALGRRSSFGFGSLLLRLLGLGFRAGRFACAFGCRFALRRFLSLSLGFLRAALLLARARALLACALRGRAGRALSGRGLARRRALWRRWRLGRSRCRR